jgi:hypothetical protein
MLSEGNNPDRTRAGRFQREQKFASLVIGGMKADDAYVKAFNIDMEGATPTQRRGIKFRSERLCRSEYVQNQIRVASSIISSGAIEKAGADPGKVLKEMMRIVEKGEKESDRIAAGKVVLSALGADAPKENKARHLTVNVVTLDANSLINAFAGHGNLTGECHSAIPLLPEAVSSEVVAGAPERSEAAGAGQSQKVG